MTFSIPDKTRTLWQLRLAAVFVLFFVLVCILFGLTLISLVVNIIVCVFATFILFIYVPFYFKSYLITVEHNAICIKKGVLFKSVYIMPFPRLVFAQSFVTPVSVVLNLKSIMLKAARGWIFIPEIEKCYAEHLLNVLKVVPYD